MRAPTRTRARDDGALVPLETRTETFHVAGGDDVSLEVRSTVHGPIVSGLTDDFTAIADDPATGSTDDVRTLDDEASTTGAADSADATAGATETTVPSGEYAVSLRWTALDAGTTAAAIFAAAGAVWIPKPPCPAHQKKPGAEGSNP